MATATATRRPLSPLDRLDASLQDFEPSIGSRHSTTTTTTAGAGVGWKTAPMGAFGYPSTHSGFRSSDGMMSDPDEEDLEEVGDDGESDASAGGYSPPAWRRLGNGDRSSGFWRTNDKFGGSGFGGRPGFNNATGFGGGVGGGVMRSREATTVEDYDSGDETDLDAILQAAIRTRLPTGSLSPERRRSPEPEYPKRMQVSRVRIKEEDELAAGIDERLKSTLTAPPELADNYIRFAVRAEVQQRTEPIEAAINFLRSRFGFVVRSWASFLATILVTSVSIMMTKSLFQPAALPPNLPDLVKVAGVARSFEPLIYYADHGIRQIGDLQNTAVAVWDLGETVRHSDIPSAAGISAELDGLADNLNALVTVLTKFFTSVNGDIDHIIMVLNWVRREVSQLEKIPSSSISKAYDNIHNVMSAAGIMEDTTTGEPTPVGGLITSIFGRSLPSRTRRTVHSSFKDLLSVLEESIATELDQSVVALNHFDSIDLQFSNLAGLVVHETVSQDDAHASMLSSLWTRVLGANAGALRKFERNRQLLANVRRKTVSNKNLLLDHNQKLHALKANLEDLRRKLASPLVRSENSSSAMSLVEQVHGLDEVHAYLEGVRRTQKAKLKEYLAGEFDRLQDRRPPPEDRVMYVDGKVV